jgi:hypothetical protein
MISSSAEEKVPDFGISQREPYLLSGGRPEKSLAGRDHPLPLPAVRRGSGHEGGLAKAMRDRPPLLSDICLTLTVNPLRGRELLLLAVPVRSTVVQTVPRHI